MKMHGNHPPSTDDPLADIGDGVLVIDDDPAICEICASALSGSSIPCFTATAPLMGLGMLAANRSIGIVVVDLLMPEMNGLDFIRKANESIRRDIAYIVMTGFASEDSAIDSLRLGVADFLHKPINFPALRDAVVKARRLVEHWREQRTEKAFLAREVRKAMADLERAYEQTVRCLGIAAEYKDEETGQHSQRIGAYAKVLAAQLELPQDEQEIIEIAAPLHDVGKIGVPECVLIKSRGLSGFEVDAIREHSRIGHEILRTAASHPIMVAAAEIALHHHERFDGTGYPDRLRGDAISIESRITAVCDVYDALRSPRPYKPALSHEQAVEILLRGDHRTKPHHFDPDVLAAFGRCAGKFDDIWRRRDFVQVEGEGALRSGYIGTSCIEHMRAAQNSA